LTGDRNDVAGEVASAIGLDSFHAQQTPRAKADKIREWQKAGEIVAMVMISIAYRVNVGLTFHSQVGDGVNDAQALGQADVGIALYSGSPLAAASADIVLLRSSLRDIAPTISAAKAVHSTVKANILWAVLYNVLLIPLAMGAGRPWGIVLYP
jgi:P-type Cu2+ transporter